MGGASGEVLSWAAQKKANFVSSESGFQTTLMFLHKVEDSKSKRDHEATPHVMALVSYVISFIHTL